MEGARPTNSEERDGRSKEPSPSELLDRSKMLNFEFNGRRMSAFEGDTVASALYASGVRIFSRSFKYHRPRGLLCVSGRCPNCLMSVDGVPNVKACTERVRAGMKVKSQNCWPSLEHDIFSVIDKIGRFLPVGFYYKTFINPPIEWSRVEWIIRRLTGLGDIEEEIASATGKGPKDGRSIHSSSFEHLNLQADVAVIGGGPCGIFAALEAGNAGARVVLVDDQPALGGHLRYSGETLSIDVATGEGAYSGLKSSAVASTLEKAVRDHPNMTVLDNSTAFGIYESNLIGIVRGNSVIRLRAEQLVFATGAHEFPSVFQNNDLPEVFLGRGMQRLINLYGVIPGKRAVVVSNNDSGLDVARTLMDAGVKLEAYIDSRKAVGAPETLAEIEDAKVQTFLGWAVKEARGSKHVSSIVICEVDNEGELVHGTERVVSCDLVSLSTGFETEAWLLNQTGSRTIYDELLREFIPRELKSTVYVCGDLTGIHDLNIAIMQGKVAGLSAAANLPAMARSSELKVEYQRKSLETYSRLVSQHEGKYREGMKRTRGPEVLVVEYPGSDKMRKRFVCVCEDVVAKDISLATFEGFDDIETLKRYSTVTMGPCQGKMCSMPSLHLCSRVTGRSIAQTGRTVSRPPYVPVAMGALAGAELHPVKLTGIHYKHIELGARIMDMGEWKRPHVYTSVEEEYKAVRESVGVIDVSTLGRLDVKGRDAGKLLDFVYTHIFSTLKVGKSRYGVICDDAGIVLDDGTVTRLSETHYFITTTTGNVEFVEEWLVWWATALRLDAYITNVTAGLGAVNVAGPKARDLLRKLTTVDLSSGAFPYMNSAEGEVAGVPCILLRIGFVGETGWEIHFPAEFGEYFWDTLLEAGKEFGVKPFGVETQRVLRLEKKHVIVGQDTDALSNPFEADMAWTVKFEKEDFVGKAALVAAEKKEPDRMLVGFVMKDSMVAHDGDQVFSQDGSRHIGFVTSSRFSPKVGRCVGMALVSPEYYKEGSLIRVKSDDALNGAEVTLAPFYDPEGKRLRA